MKKGRFAIGLLVLFLAGELWIHSNRTAPVFGGAGESWTVLARGAYEAVPGRFGGVEVLLPDAERLPVLEVQTGHGGPEAVPGRPERIMEIKGFGRLELWGAKEPKLATLTVGGRTERLPLAPDGSAVLLVRSSLDQIYRLDLTRAGATPTPLLPATIGGVSRSSFMAQAPREAWTPLWAEAPFFGRRATTIYYFSNRLQEAGSPTMELWSFNPVTRRSRLVETGNGLAAFGEDARGRVIMADASGRILAVEGFTTDLLGSSLRPIAMGPGGLRALVENTKTGSLFVLDLVSDRLEKVALGEDGYAGQASFSPDGSSLAVAARTPGGVGCVLIYRLAHDRIRLQGRVLPPKGKKAVLDAPISWIDQEHVVLVLTDPRSALSTWTYGGTKGF